MKTLILRTPGAPEVETDRFSKYLLKHFAIECEFEVRETNVKAEKEVLFDNKREGFVKLQNGYRYYSQYPGYDCIVIVWKPDTEKFVSNSWYHPSGTYVLEVGLLFADDFYRVVSHEILHAFWWKVASLGFQRVDTMDIYDLEMFPDAENGNRARNILALQPYRDRLDPQKTRKSALQSRINQLTELVKALLAKKVFVPSGRKEIEATFGKPGENLEVFELPYPLFYNGVQVKVSRCHKKMVPIFKAVLSEIRERGLEKYVQNYGGIYAYRDQRTGEKLSTHAWGISIDIEPLKLPLGSKNRLPQSVIDVFTRHGFVYGGDFPTPDPMHMQYCKDY